jgi:hypothetical protein
LRDAGDLHFVLPYAYRFDDDEVFACRIQQHGQVRGRPRQAADRTARRHGAYEDALVGVVAQHAYAVAQ